MGIGRKLNVQALSLTASFLYNVSSREDVPFLKRKKSLDQLQQHDNDFMSYNFNYDDQLTLNNNDSVMVDVMTMDDILLEILENKTG